MPHRVNRGQRGNGGGASHGPYCIDVHKTESQICVLRSYLRQRAMLVTYASHHI